MISLFTGMPGAGKTAAMVDVLRVLCNERPVYVHYNEEEKLRSEQKLLHETLKIPHFPCDARNWHKELPDGAILVIDEAQGCWRPRPASSKVPEYIAALETHRHAGIDVFLTTQSPKLIDANVRNLIGRHVHIRDTGWIGRYWYEWPECNELVSWKTCLIKKKYKLEKKVFDLYVSANEHTKVPRVVPKTIYLIVILLLILGYLIFRVSSNLANKNNLKNEVELNKQNEITENNNEKYDENMLNKNSIYGLNNYENNDNNQHNNYDLYDVNSNNGIKLIDDRVDWIPRVSSFPESAPVYDHLREVKTFPIIVGGACTKNKCLCYSQQGTIIDISYDECKNRVDKKRFNPYLDDNQIVKSSSINIIK